MLWGRFTTLSTPPDQASSGAVSDQKTFIRTRHTADSEQERSILMQFGVSAEDLKESVLLRFNPHHVMHGGQKEELPDIDLRIKALIQTIRNELTPRTRLEIPVMRVKYLFYGTDSRQRANAEHASGTVVLCDDINDVDVSTLDEDIAEFSLLSVSRHVP